jgi:hypothetical protein
MSGKLFVVPLLNMPDGPDVIVVASQGGRPENPQWYRNPVANTTPTSKSAPSAGPCTPSPPDPRMGWGSTLAIGAATDELTAAPRPDRHADP